MATQAHDRPPNETQVAVALKYDGDTDPAPRVTATGRGTIAEQIIAVARANGIEVREDADLATLLSVLEVDDYIPVEAFAAVAEILSYIYRKNAGVGGARP